MLLFNFIIHLLIYNLFLPYRLCDFWYETQKKVKKYVTEKELPGWKDFRPSYISEVV
jgi:hypothetical protein